jgi:hypothetical protein
MSTATPNICRLGDDLTGQEFGRLTALRIVGRSATRGYIWECRCICEATHYAHAYHLKRGHVRSCGCMVPEQVAASNRRRGRRG